MNTPPLRKNAPPWIASALVLGVVLALAIALGLVAKAPEVPAGMGRMAPRVPSRPQDLRTLLWLMGVGSSLWYACVAAFPLMLWGARRLDMERFGRLRLIVLMLTLFVALVAAASAGQYYELYRGLENRPEFLNFLPVALRQVLLPIIALAAVVAAIEVRRRAVHSQLDRERLRAQVAEQRLIALTGQLQPHFLFNTLQGISTLMHRSPREADAMLSLLSDLLRDLLRHRDHVLVPLSDELRYARTFLDLAKFRFAERLDFQISAAPELMQFTVPLFILQPMLENALSHGIGTVGRGGRIDVNAWRTGDRLHLEVSDNGAGFPTGTPLIEGVGLSNTRERLQASFGHDQLLALSAREGGGTVAHLDIPCQTTRARWTRTPGDEYNPA